MNLAPPPAFGAVSPMREMGAYEWLWQQDDGPVKPSFKAVAQLFRDNPGALPSDLVDPDDAIACARKVLDRFEKSGVGSFSVRMHGIGDYQEKLRDAENPLEFLYYQGNWDLAYSPKRVAIVGTRSPTDEGIRRARKLTALLVKENYTIVSGLANGYARIYGRDGQWRHITPDTRPLAYETFAAWAVERLAALNLGPVVLVPVPSSSCTGYSAQTCPLAMAQAIQGRMRDVVTIGPWLRFAEPQPRSHEGGSRNQAVLRAALRCSERFRAGRIVLIDDVKTTGAHMLACTEKLREHGAEVSTALVAGKTVWAQVENPYAVEPEDLEGWPDDL